MPDTLSRFQFSDINRSGDGNTLTAAWLPDAAMPMFAGHFPGLPIMPAVAQIALLQALMRQHSDWGRIICGGSKLKFSALIQPGDRITLELEHNDGSVRFNISKPAGPASKGVLTLVNEHHD